MFKYFILIFLFLTFSFSNEILIQNTNTNDEPIFPSITYDKKYVSGTEEIFPIDVSSNNEDFQIVLKEKISKKLTEKKYVNREYNRFLMCFIFEIKHYVNSEEEFKEFKESTENDKTKAHIINVCSKTIKITKKNLSNFVNILNEI